MFQLERFSHVGKQSENENDSPLSLFYSSDFFTLPHFRERPEEKTIMCILLPAQGKE
jgi:hypothetical protein